MHRLFFTRVNSRTNMASKQRKMWFRCLRMNRAVETFLMQTYLRLCPGCFGEEDQTSKRRRGHSSQPRRNQKWQQKFPKLFFRQCHLWLTGFVPLLCAHCMWSCLLLHWLVFSCFSTLAPSNWQSGCHQNILLLNLQDSWKWNFRDLPWKSPIWINLCQTSKPSLNKRLCDLVGKT